MIKKLFFLLVRGIGKIFILFSKLLIDMFRLRILKFEVDGSKAMVLELLFFKAL